MSSPKLIVTPAEAIARARIRDRRRPRPNVRAGIGGWMEWRLVDRSGKEVSGGETHNLILDEFLDQLAIKSGNTFQSSSTPQSFLTYCAVGTGSTEPAVADTALVAQVGARTNTYIQTQNKDSPSNGVFRFMVEYEFDFAAGNGNLTEWGIALTSSGALVVRELFRDELGDPVTVTKTSDYKLRLKYTVQFTLSPVVLTPGSFDITGIGTINGDYTFVSGGGGGFSAIDCFMFMLRGNVSTNPAAGLSSIPSVSDEVLTGYTANLDNPQAIASFDLSSFTSGVWERTVDATFGTANANITIATIGLFLTSSNAASRDLGFGFGIDVGDRFAKDGLHILTIDQIAKFTWGREGS